MNVTSPSLKPESGARLRREIHRFIQATRERGEIDFDRRRRAQRRYHRSWPLVVSVNDGRHRPEMCVALHNASPLGIAFLCPQFIPLGTTILIRLFWHEVSCPFVPAVVRHATQSPHGYLIGCAFALGDDSRDRCPHGRRNGRNGRRGLKH